ncbi:hypothetical protein D3C77_708680 [compost metagenome]
MPNAITNITAQASSGMVRRNATSVRMAKRNVAGLWVLLAAKKASPPATSTERMVAASASCKVSQISGNWICNR